MMKLQLSKERKILIGVAVVLLILVFGYRLLPLIQSMGEEGDALELKEQRIVKYLQRIQDGPVLERKKDLLYKNLEALKEGLLHAKTPSLAAVLMQNLLHEKAESIGVEIKTTRVLSSAKIEKTEYVAIPVQISADLTVQQAKELIYKIESDETFFFVTKMQLRRHSDQLPIQLQAVITIKGLMQESADE